MFGTKDSKSWVFGTARGALHLLREHLLGCFAAWQKLLDGTYVSMSVMPYQMR